MEQALHLRQRLASLLDALGLQRNPTKGFWEPCQWFPVRELQSLAGQAQYLFLAIPAARFFLRELHSVGGDRWGGRFRMTPQLHRDLQWWTSVPSQSNGKPIHRPVETAYLHTDSSGYGWGGVLNGMLEARGFWSSADECQHITWKELKAVRLAMESFLPHLAGRNVLLREDNKALDLLMFAELESRFGPHSIDRFASALNTLLPNAAWLDPTCEAVDSLHLPDADWRRENNWCNAPWPLLPDLVQKLQQSGAAATVVAPRWEGKAWHQALTEMAVEELTVAPRAGLFRPGRRDGRASSLQPYLSAVNNFVKDYRGREPMALGDMVSKVRKGLAASQVTLNPELMRAPLPARVVLKALMTLAKALRLELGPTWGRDPSTVPRFHALRAWMTTTSGRTRRTESKLGLEVGGLADRAVRGNNESTEDSDQHDEDEDEDGGNEVEGDEDEGNGDEEKNNGG
eukprot:jgi/Tetstr1/444783/TSEL_032631.t1